jgi:hypothetical protein
MVNAFSQERVKPMAEITITTETPKTEAEEIGQKLQKPPQAGPGNGKEQKSLKVNLQ